MMARKTIRLVTLAEDGSFRERDLEGLDDLLRTHDQIGIDDCSTDLSLRGLPIFRGLIGPIPETGNVARYESPEVFESLTKEWSKAKPKRRRRKAAETTETPTPQTRRVPPPMAIPVVGGTIPTTVGMVTS